MKKRNLRIVALMLLVALVIPCYANAGDGEAQKDKMLTDEEMMELMVKQGPAMAAYEQLMEAWFSDIHEIDYPNSFGGFYHTDDFKLAIKVVNGDERFIEETRAIVSDPSVLEFVETDISINQLFSLKDSVAKDLADIDTTKIGVCQSDSCVHIEFDSKDLPALRALVMRKAVNNDHIRVTFADSEYSTQSVTYNPGNIITNIATSPTSDNKIGTLGCYGTYEFQTDERKDCFLTAGHVQMDFQYNTKNMYFNGKKVFDNQYYPNGQYGARYCEVECGDSVDSAGLPEGNSLGDYAVMRCNAGSSVGETINFTNKIQMNGYSMTATDYLGSSVKEDLLDGTIDIYDKNAIKSLCNRYVTPESTRVMKGLGINGSSCAWGVITEIYVDMPYEFNNKFHGYIKGSIEIRPADTSGKPFSNPGDSGGPVYYGNYNSSGNVTLLGIISIGQIKNDTSGIKTYRTGITPMPILLGYSFVPYVG